MQSLDLFACSSTLITYWQHHYVNEISAVNNMKGKTLFLMFTYRVIS